MDRPRHAQLALLYRLTASIFPLPAGASLPRPVGRTEKEAERTSYMRVLTWALSMYSRKSNILPSLISIMKE